MSAEVTEKYRGRAADSAGKAVDALKDASTVASNGGDPRKKLNEALAHMREGSHHTLEAIASEVLDRKEGV